MVSGDINDVVVNTTGLAFITMARDPFDTNQVGYTMTGGPVILDNTPFLLIEAPSHTLLKGSICNYYTGNIWFNSIPKTQHRFESSFWNRELKETFSLDISLWDDIPKELQRMMSGETEIRIKHLQQNTSSLYGAGKVFDVISNDGDGIIPYFDMNGDMFSKFYVNTNSSYSIKTYLINYDYAR